MNKSAQTITAFVFGVVFVLAILIIAIVFPYPTRFQLFTFKVVLALAAGGVAAMIPGFIAAKITNFVRAGGALAVFVVVFFFNPAELAVEGKPTEVEGVFIKNTETSNGRVQYFWKQGNFTFELPSAEWSISTKAAESGLGDITLKHQSGMDAQIQLHVSFLDQRHVGHWDEFTKDTVDLWKGTIEQFGTFETNNIFVDGISGFQIHGFVMGQAEGIKKVDLVYAPLGNDRLLEVHLTRNTGRADEPNLVQSLNKVLSTIKFDNSTPGS